MSSKNNSEHNEGTIPAGYTLDYISGKPVKETSKELVRQRIVRALIARINAPSISSNN